MPVLLLQIPLKQAVYIIEYVGKLALKTRFLP